MGWLCSGMIVMIKFKVLEFGMSVNSPWGFTSKAKNILLFRRYILYTGLES